MYHKGLMICSNPPFPEGDGGRSAIRQDIKSVIKHNPFIHWDVIVLWSDDTTSTARWLDKQDGIKDYWIFDKPYINPINFFKNHPEHIERFVSHSVIREILKVLVRTKYKAVILNGIYSGIFALLARYRPYTQVIYRSHNIEYLLWQQVLNNDLVTLSQVPLSFYALNEFIKYRRFETAVWRNVYEVWSISYHDTFIITKHNKRAKWVLPEFPNNSVINKRIKSDGLTAFLLTSYKWFPNKLGILFWLRNIFPKISKSLYNWKFIIGGLGTEGLYGFSSKNLEIAGWIDDLEAYFNKSIVFFVPVWISSGVRIKIIEAALRGKLIVSTFEGIKGLPLIKWKHYIPVDATPRSWIKAFKWIEENSEEAINIAIRGQQYMLRLLDNYNKPIIEL